MWGVILYVCYSFHVVVFGTHRPVGRTCAACAIQNGWNVSRVVPGSNLRAVLDADMDMIAVDGTCVTPRGVAMLRKEHGERVHVVHTREEARYLMRDVKYDFN